MIAINHMQEIVVGHEAEKKGSLGHYETRELKSLTSRKHLLKMFRCSASCSFALEMRVYWKIRIANLHCWACRIEAFTISEIAEIFTVGEEFFRWFSFLGKLPHFKSNQFLPFFQKDFQNSKREAYRIHLQYKNFNSALEELLHVFHASIATSAIVSPMQIPFTSISQ